MKRPAFLFMFLMIYLAFSCKQQQNITDSSIPSISASNTDSINKNPIRTEIFYGVLTPVQITAIFDRLGVPSNNSILNPVSNKELYLSSSKAAINTGVYGADFGYLKIFGVGQELIDYIVTIRDMSNKLGIPDKFITEPIRRVQGDMANPDTIMFLMDNAFTNMESHLRESGRESTAGLMVMGGWIEAMYIATQIVYDPSNPDSEVIQRIAEQKFTLTTLLGFLKNYYDDPVVVYYSKKLKYLKNYFDSFDIYFKKGDLEIDTAKQVFRSTETKMNISVETLNNIRDYLAKLRTEIVMP